MSNTCISASDLRRRAWNALAGSWPKALSIIFVINLISFLTEQIAAVLPPIIGSLLSIVVSLALSVMHMGLVRGVLDHLRGGRFTFAHILSAFPCAGQMICYNLLVALFAILWMLPGIILSSIGMGILGPAQDGTGYVALGGVIVFLGVCLMLALTLRAAINYALGACCIVDDPNMGSCAALTKSKQLMRGRRWLFVRMSLPMFIMISIVVAIRCVLMGKMDDTLLSAGSYLLTTVLQAMLVYLESVLYEEVNRIPEAVHRKNKPSP